jgi:hypothetical protein
MKKVYATILTVCIVALGYSQNSIDADHSGSLELEKSDYTITNIATPHIKKQLYKLNPGGWLSQPALMQSKGGFWQNATFTRLFPDSFVNIVGTDGMLFQPAFHAIGSSFDPRDPLYVTQTIDAGGWQVGLHDSYNLDSIAFTYAYVRETRTIQGEEVETDLIDTLFVYYIGTNGMNQFRFNDVNNGGFGVPTGLNVNTLSPLVFSYVDTILLDDMMATQFDREGTNLSTSAITIAIPENLRRVDHLFNDFGSRPIGYSLVYKPGLKYSFGDTIINFSEDINLSTQFNDFGVVTYGNEGSNLSDGRYFNNTFVSNRQVRYGQLFGSIRGHLPIIANLGWQRDLYLASFFHVSENEDRKWGSVATVAQPLATRVYPNPVAAGGNVTVQLLEDVTLSEVNIKMVDILGNQISTKTTIMTDAAIEVSTENLAKGIYLIQVSFNNKSTTHRVFVQ